MNITKKEIDQLNMTLSIEVAPADYSEQVEKQLHKMRSRVNMPGFRPGKVPFGMVKKMYGKSVMADEINNILSESLMNYIKDNDLNPLGEPMPNEELTHANFDTDDTFTFAFDLGLAPEFELSFSSDDKIVAYDITVDDSMIDRQVEMYAQRFGQTVKGEEVKDRDLVKGLLTELQDGEVKEGGIVAEDAIVAPERMKEEQKALFQGQKVGAKVVFNPQTAFGNAAEIASLLGVSKEVATDMQSDFCFEIKEITRFEAAEVNQALFDKVFGEGNVKDEAEFRQKVAAEIKSQRKEDENYRFGIDAKAAVLKKMEGLQFPDAFLKRWLMASNDGKYSAEDVERDYPQMIEELKWSLAQSKIAKAHDLKVDDADVREYAKMMTRMQFAQYGLTGIDDQLLEKYAEESLKKEDQVRGIANRVMENKVIDSIKAEAGLEVKSISMEDFAQLFANDK